VSLHGAESPQGTLSRAKNNAKNCLALENAANEDRKYCSTQFFSSLLVADIKEEGLKAAAAGGHGGGMAGMY
jgi:hypothetical protein